MTIPRHSFTMWLTLQKKLSTRDRLCRFLPNIESGSLLCGERVESCTHLFFGCEWSKELLAKMMQWLGVSNWPTGYSRWAKWLRYAGWKLRKHILIAGIAGLVNRTWMERNLRYFEQKERPVERVFKELRR